MRRLASIARVLCVLIVAAAAAPSLANTCDPGEKPDVIVGDLYEVKRHGNVGGVTAYSIGTHSCNVGTCWLNWIWDTNQHPVIAQNVFRLKDGRFEQIGQSWVKHGFQAFSLTLCSTACEAGDGDHLGVNCSDPYSANLNGEQDGLGPKFEVNASTGFHPHPVTDIGETGDQIYKRLQVHDADLDPTLNAGALYFIEGQYVTEDDAAAGNQNNNASYRPALVTPAGGGKYDVSVTGTTQREQPAISAWAATDPSVSQVDVDVPGDGRFIVSARATDLGGGVWNYEYAVQNLNSHRSAASFSVPIPYPVNVTGTGFHDVDYHSGEPYDGTDWPATVTAFEIRWETVPYGADPDANALRWGTLYNFRFDADAPPQAGNVTLGLFRPGSPGEVVVPTVIPSVCNDDGTCDPGESCIHCGSDCPDTGPDDDSDTYSICRDCDDADGSIWDIPGEVLDLRVDSGGFLTWNPPADPGSIVVTYETLRSTNPADFMTAPVCIPPVDPEDTFLTDPSVPAPLEAYHYLVRAVNACPNGVGTLGEGTTAPRVGADCP